MPPKISKDLKKNLNLKIKKDVKTFKHESIFAPKESAFNKALSVYNFDTNIKKHPRTFKENVQTFDANGNFTGNVPAVYNKGEYNYDWDTPIQIRTKLRHKMKYKLTGIKKRHFEYPFKTHVTINFRIMRSNGQYDEPSYFDRSISVKARVIDNEKNMNIVLNELLDELLEEAFTEKYKDSIHEILSTDLITSQYKPKLGKSYKDLPPQIKSKKAIVNIQNKDNLCFIYSVLCHVINPGIKPERVSKYVDHLDKVKFKMIDFVDGIEPSNSKIDLFEKQNKMSINIYTASFYGENISITPTRISKQKFDVVNLFYHDEHYSYIKNFQRFAGKSGHNMYHCERCLASFRWENKYIEHVIDCENMNITQKTIMPKCDLSIDCDTNKILYIKPTMHFKNHSNQNRVPIVIYGDFEAINKKVNVKSKSKDATMVKKTEHQSASYRFHIKSDIPLNIPLDYEYCGKYANEHFTKTILDIEKKLQWSITDAKEKYGDVKNMIMSTEQKKEHAQATICRFCNKKIINKVRDHCHYTGQYRGPACTTCNIQACPPKKTPIPFVFHNLNYDLRQIINSFAKMTKVELDEHNNCNINCIAGNSENYKTLNLNSYKFIDSMAFIMASLEKLIENVPDEKKMAMRKITNDPELFKLICKKGEFPYDWFDDFGKLSEDVTIPDIETFYNKIKDEHLSKEQYDDMMDTVQKFGIKNFKEFHDLYLKRDVYGLVDVFETFRDISVEAYGLDPAWYLGLPGFSWDAMLKKTSNEIELLTDVDMYMFFEKGIRGGMSKAVTRYFKANNKYLPEHDASKKSSFLMYLDANNLYGLAMVQKLPYSKFEWMNKNELDNWRDVPCTLEVDLSYPKELHDLHNEYPLAPEHKNIKESEISDYSKKCLKDSKSKFATKNKKLVATLNDKKNYIIHHETLKQYLDLGMVLTKIHKGIKYVEKEWLKDYIDFNTKKRTKCKTDYEKDLYKLMNNAVFGKSMENVRDRISLRFALSEDKFNGYTSKPDFKRVITGIGGENFRILEMNKPSVNLNKPIFCGQAILDLSKSHMYDFYYKTMKPKYGDKMKLVLTDTDSFIFGIETKDFYEDMKDMKNQFDTSAYPKDHELHSTVNEKVLGKFKDELCNKSFSAMSEVISLRSKVYAYKTDSGKCNKTLKGVNKIVKEKEIKFNDYENCLIKGKIVSKKQTSIRSFQCKNYTIEQTKKCLSPYDDKRYIKSCGVQTLAYGHYSIQH